MVGLIVIIVLFAFVVALCMTKIEELHKKLIADQQYIDYLKRVNKYCCDERDEIKDRYMLQLEELADLRARQEGDPDVEES